MTVCAICVEYEKGKLTNPEALSALAEMILTGDIDDDHAEEVKEKILGETLD